MLVFRPVYEGRRSLHRVGTSVEMLRDQLSKTGAQGNVA